jgi:periplasmic divalent cation tolerance protein
MPEAVLVLTTVATSADAERLARTLVEERLAACVNLVGPIRSIYRWEGKVCDEGEVLLICKTVPAGAENLERRLTELHPYQVPEVVAVAADRVCARYAAWLQESVG